VASWQGGGNYPPYILACQKIVILLENFPRKSIRRKGIFTRKLRQPGWTEQSKVVSECFVKHNFFMQIDELHEKV